MSRPPTAQTPIVAELEVDSFRSVHRATLTLSSVCALVGEPRAGKSNLLAAIRAVLDPSLGGARTRRSAELAGRPQ